MGDPLEQLKAEAAYHRQRYDLYRQKAYGPRPTSESRMRELERAARSAEQQLAAAREKQRSAGDPPPLSG